MPGPGGFEKKHFALLVGLVGIFGFGELVGIHQERAKYPQIILAPEVQELSQNVAFDPRLTNANDALLWSASLPEAKLCDNCNALQEFQEGIHYSRPIILQVRGDEVGNTSNVGYTMVVGVVSESHEVGRRIAPRIIYYIGQRSGSLARIDELGKVEYRTSEGKWTHLQDLGDDNALLVQVREAFQQKWQHQLASARTQ